MRAKILNPDWLIGATVNNHDGTPLGTVESFASDWPGVVNVRTRNCVVTVRVKEFDDQGLIVNEAAIMSKYITGKRLV
jgi:hypothetical protein